jgi:GT2 family glycosyltransferase
MVSGSRKDSAGMIRQTVDRLRFIFKTGLHEPEGAEPFTRSLQRALFWPCWQGWFIFRWIESVLPASEDRYQRLCLSPGKKIAAVIVPCHNGLEYTKRFVDSLMRGNRAFNTVLMIYDNHSTDGTEDYFKGLRCENMVYFRYKKNTGVARPWNDGVRFALKNLNAQYIFLANNDVVLPENGIETMIRVLETNTAAGLVGPLTNAPGPEGLQDIRRYVADDVFSPEPMDVERINQKLQGGKPLEVERLYGFLWGGTRKAFEKNVFVGGGPAMYFDPRNVIYQNEREFQRRFQKTGLKLFIATETFVFHYQGVTCSKIQGVKADESA